MPDSVVMTGSSAILRSTRSNCSSRLMSLSTASLLAHTSVRFCSFEKPRRAVVVTMYTATRTAYTARALRENMLMCLPNSSVHTGWMSCRISGTDASILITDA